MSFVSASHSRAPITRARVVFFAVVFHSPSIIPVKDVRTEEFPGADVTALRPRRSQSDSSMMDEVFVNPRPLSIHSQTNSP